MVLTGIPQFTTNAMRYYPNPMFWPKMSQTGAALPTDSRASCKRLRDTLPAWRSVLVVLE